MANRFAEGTSVSVPKTRIELEELLAKYKADQIASGLEPGRATIAFRIAGRLVRFEMPLATDEDSRLIRRRGWSLTESQRLEWLDQEHRTRWRALLLTVKAKLVSVENNVETFEEAFLAHLVIPGAAGTVGKLMLPQLAEAYRTGKPLLLGAGHG